MPIQDMRSDLRGEVATYFNIGSGFGSFFGGLEGEKVRKQKEFESHLLKNSELAVIQTIAQGSAEGWDKKTIHEQLMQIPQAVETETFRQFSMRGAGTTGSASAADSPMAQLKYWQDALNKAIQGDDKKMEAFAQQQIDAAMRLINPDYFSSNTDTEITEGSDKLAAKMQQGVNEVMGTGYGTLATAGAKATNKNDKEIEKELSDDESYPDPKRSVRAAIDANPTEAQRQLKLAKKAMQTKSPYPEYPDAFLEKGVWKVIIDGKKYRIEN